MAIIRYYICTSQVSSNYLTSLFYLNNLKHPRGQLLSEAKIKEDLFLEFNISHAVHGEEILSTSLKLNQHILKILK